MPASEAGVESLSSGVLLLRFRSETTPVDVASTRLSTSLSMSLQTLIDEMIPEESVLTIAQVVPNKGLASGGEQVELSAQSLAMVSKSFRESASEACLSRETHYCHAPRLPKPRLCPSRLCGW